MRTPHLPLLLVAVCLVTAGCRNHDDDDSKSADVPVHLSRNPDTTSGRSALQAGDIRIASVDSGVDLALIGDTISGGLSQKTLAKVKHETDAGAVQGSGLGSEIARMVKGTVQSALGTRIAIPLSAVRDVHYDGRKIVFDWNGKPRTPFSHVNVNDKDALESFSAADAQRFVDAVRARKRALGRQM